MDTMGKKKFDKNMLGKIQSGDIDWGASRHWCVTAYDPEFKNRLDEKCPEEIRYIIVGEEYTKEGRLHWQTYVEFHTKKPRLGGVKKILGDNTIHCEIRWGDREGARDYCKKEEKWNEYGEWIKGQGHRTDLDVMCKRLLDGESLRDVATEDPSMYCRYRNGIRDFAAWGQEKASRRFRRVEVHVVTGETGTNKTRNALYTDGDDGEMQGYLLDAPADGKALWFDGYDAQETLIIDEFYGGIKYSTLLRLLDGHQMRLPIKGTHAYARWTKVIITSNKRPEDWYTFGMTQALARRIRTLNGEDYRPEVLGGNTVDPEHVTDDWWRVTREEDQ